MADHDATWTTPLDDTPPVEAPPVEVIAEHLGGSYWSVDEDRWSAWQPALPAELVELLAPPVLVGAAPTGTDT